MREESLHPTRPFRFLRFSATSALINYSLVLFLIATADAIMSYSVPVFLKETLGSSFWMGIIIATSSIAGVVADIILGEWFGNKKYTFFLWGALIAALAFPLTLLFLPPLIPFFLLAMAIWGLYYELIQFANYRFIRVFMSKEHHAQSWGIISAFASCAYLIGPLLAEFLIDRNSQLPFGGTICFLLSGIGGFLVFLNIFSKKTELVPPITERKQSLFHELEIWKTLLRVIWPLWLFHFALILVEVAFWTVGTVFSEELRRVHPYGGFFLTAWCLPALFIGLWAGKAARPLGKKRAAFLAGFLEGIVLLFFAFTHNVPALLVLVFISSAFGAIAHPELSGTFEDYVARLGPFGNHLIGLNLSSASLAFIIGPVFAGGLASLFGSQAIFPIMGGLLVVASLFTLLITPRKIRLPQQTLAEIENRHRGKL